MKFAPGDCLCVNALGLECIDTWNDGQIDQLRGRPLWTSGSLPPDHSLAHLGMVSCFLNEARKGAVYNLHEAWLEPWPVEASKPDHLCDKCGEKLTLGGFDEVGPVFFDGAGPHHTTIRCQARQIADRDARIADLERRLARSPRLPRSAEEAA